MNMNIGFSVCTQQVPVYREWPTESCVIENHQNGTFKTKNNKQKKQFACYLRNKRMPTELNRAIKHEEGFRCIENKSRSQ